MKLAVSFKRASASFPFSAIRTRSFPYARYRIHPGDNLQIDVISSSSTKLKRDGDVGSLYLSLTTWDPPRQIDVEAITTFEISNWRDLLSMPILSIALDITESGMMSKAFLRSKETRAKGLSFFVLILRKFFKDKLWTQQQSRWVNPVCCSFNGISAKRAAWIRGDMWADSNRPSVVYVSQLFMPSSSSQHRGDSFC